jgi:hypothetical protein
LSSDTSSALKLEPFTIEFRSTKPKTLLRISATLFSHAIQARLAQQIDGDVLSNGVSYFTGPLLNWTLVGVIKGLAREIQFRGWVLNVCQYNI